MRLPWVYISSAGWEATPLQEFQATHDTSAPLNTLPVPQQNEILTERFKAQASQEAAMSSRTKYLKRPDLFVVAVQLDLETSGFTYRKWGGTQVCKAGDWLVSNDGDTYTVDRESFARTYRATGPGTYVKTTPVWAEVARTGGEIRTKEGATRYQAGDYVVFNQPDGGDGYAISKSKFERMYQPAE